MTEPTILENLASEVGKCAPILGTLLGSPLAGAGIVLLAQLFNVNPNDTVKLLDTIKNDPDATNKIKTLAIQNQEIIAQFQSLNFSNEISNRKDARARELTLKDHVPAILAIGYFISYVAVQFYCIIYVNPIDDIISARFQDIFIMIISYYFGSMNKDQKPIS